MPARSPAAPPVGSARPRRRRFSSSICPELLETRVLMSLSVTGSEIPLDPTQGHWSVPSVAMDADGDFVAAWDVTLEDFDLGWSHFWPEVQRFDRSGNPLGGVIRPDDRPLKGPDGETILVDRHGISPSVATDDAGNFVVVWSAADDDVNHNNYLLARRYAADGRPRGPLFQVSPYQSGPGWTYVNMPVAMNGRGDFVIPWAHGTEIRVSRYNAAGEAVGEPVLVDTTARPRAGIRVAIDDAGGFAVLWGEYARAGDSSDTSTLFVRHFGPDGRPAGSRRFVAGNVSPTEAQVVMDADGDTVVSWDDRLGSFLARRYSAAGQPLGDTITIAQAPAGSLVSGDVAIEPGGEFLATWGVVNEPADQGAIFARQYTASGAPTGDVLEVRRASVPSLAFSDPRVTVDNDGSDANVLWVNQSTLDAPNLGIGYGVVRHLAGDPAPEPDPGPDPDPDPTPPPAANQAPATSGIPDVTVNADAGFTFIDLFGAFNDDKDADEALQLKLISNNNANLFASIQVDAPTGILDLQFAPGAAGTATLIVRATDTAGAYADASFNVTVLPAPASPPDPVTPPAGEQSPPQPAGTGTLVGRLVQKVVVNGKRRKAPAAGVEVFLDADDDGTRDPDEPAATTAADGSYAFTTLAAGKYQVRVSTPGWEVAGRRAHGKARGVLIRARQRKAAKARPMILVSTAGLV